MNRKLLINNVVCMLTLSVAITACSLDGLVKVDDPETGTNVPRDLLKSHKGAMGVYYSAIKNLSQSYSSLSLSTGLITDELRDIATSLSATSRTSIDNRFLAVDKFGHRELALPAYAQLNAARNSAVQSRHLLRTYSDSTAIPLIAHAYILEAYSVMLMAEALCSGFPMSEVEFEGDITLSNGISTTEAFYKAVSLFDSALSIQHDSLNFVNLARTGKGRALLNLGRFDSAALAVSDVPAGFAYNLTYTETTAPNSTLREAFWTSTAGPVPVVNDIGIGNFEGVNGLEWISSSPLTQDPRVPLTTKEVEGILVFDTPIRQSKFPTGNATVPLARSLDARLIEVESAFQAGGTTWLSLLNNLRSTISLPDLADPGTQEARVDLIFRERAFWNFLLGQRHGDLRRLIRQYGREPHNTFPTGAYHNIKGSFILFGDAVVFTPDLNEYQNNFRFQSCEDYNA